MTKPSPEIATLLDQAVERINCREFIGDDPVQFPHRFTDLRDVEIAAFLSASIAWGRRPMILRDCQRLLDLMHNEPHAYVMSGQWAEIDDRLNIHRTMFGQHLKYFLRGLQRIYTKYSSLDAFAAHHRAGESETPAWEFVKALQREMCDASAGAYCSQCIPVNLDSTALKRFNMALRWLVRNDGKVDLGVWRSIDKSKLFIPLDVHVADTSRQLGLLSRKSNDKKAVMQLTETLRLLDASDPVKYDFALFGIPLEQGE